MSTKCKASIKELQLLISIKGVKHGRLTPWNIRLASKERKMLIESWDGRKQDPHNHSIEAKWALKRVGMKMKCLPLRRGNR